MTHRQTPGCVGIGDRTVGPGHPAFLIAEAGVNHNGDLNLALQLVDAAAAAGVDAVKFQTFDATRVVSPVAPQAEYQRTNTGTQESQLEMVRRLELSPEEFATVRQRCLDQGVLFLSTPFDEGSADLLEDLGVPGFKVGSGDLTNHRFLVFLAAKGRPLLVSTGMASLEEVEAAVAAIRAAGNPPICLFHCVSNYPADPVDCNLKAMATLRERFCCPVGWSDHTLGSHVACAAVALGAELIEKHFTLDRSMPGPDHRASLEPGELRDLVRQIRDVEDALGDGLKAPRDSERNTADVARRSLHASRNIQAEHRILAGDLVVLRPGTGISAERIDDVIGRRAVRDVSAGQMLSESDFE